MYFSRTSVISLFQKWLKDWNEHNLEGILDFLHEDIIFENWTGEIIEGKKKLKMAWKVWFLNHGNFKFIEEDLFFDEKEQKMLFLWRLEWPSLLEMHRGKPEVRYGCDVLYFLEGKIIKKFSFSKTTIQIDGQPISLE